MSPCLILLMTEGPKKLFIISVGSGSLGCYLRAALLSLRILEWVAMPSSSGSSRPRIEPMSQVYPHWQVLNH